MTTIGLVRHGITDWNVLGRAQGISDIPLNNLGKQQASALANRLVLKGDWDIIVTSDLARAKETGQIIAAKLNLSINVFDKRIREINCGEIEGTTEEERLKKWGSNWRELDLGMEKFDDVSDRGYEFITELANTYSDKRVLVVSHGALIGLTLQRLLPERFQKTQLDNTSITILNIKQGVWNCSLYNCTKHLD
ncbi:histidine phosphatase family protein [Psychrobacillus psychrodurans]|uniref:Histidine phosphatase family protein n=1 Tax=Psychrobacillus psychrodurans TaxID=126157 RepID=A0A9X3L6L3_9BACI|nr:histidine phosphatase family protein [Psychrobacillus psychrodurans]MCZ8532198.1 histidine phosphatase family protein [Psychrobacillus psychrodurans]